jgi:AraC-like DNA-binding protein
VKKKQRAGSDVTIKIGTDPFRSGKPFRAITSTGNSTLAMAHTHGGIELFALHAGECSLFLDGTIYPMLPGDISFTDATLPHWHFSNAGESFTRTLLYLRLDAVLNALPDAGDIRLYLPFIAVRSGAAPILRNQPTLGDHFKAIAALEQNQPPLWDVEAWAMIVRVLATLVQSLPQQLPETARHFDGRQLQTIVDAVVYLQNHFREEIGIAQMAERCSLSESRFAHLFSSLMGTSPVQFRNRLRIAWAVEQLLTTDDAVETVALDSGFMSLSQFRMLFSRIMGRSPAHFRRMAP